MNFQPIDMELWKRKEYFLHYFSDVPCTYSMTVKLEITKVRASDRQIYPLMLYYLTKAVNMHEEFRMGLDGNGNLGIYDVMFPCCTVFHADSETFSTLWTEYSEEYDTFSGAYTHDVAKYSSIHKFEAKPDTPANTFSVSMIPWESFVGFNLNLQKGYQYLSPIFTMGKYFYENGKCFLPLAIQVHHAVCDGFHVCRLIEAVRSFIKEE